MVFFEALLVVVALRTLYGFYGSELCAVSAS